MSGLSSSVDKIYSKVRQMAINFEFMPGERINESALSKELGASRTPLREALNRLVAEGFLYFENGRGFFCRTLSPDKVQSLYEVRVAIESEAIRLAVTRATEEDIVDLEAFLEQTLPAYDQKDAAKDIVVLDEEFHLRLAMLSGNEELERMLANINARIHYVRCIDMVGRETKSSSDHKAILDALKSRDEEKAVTVIRKHITKRSEETTNAVRTAFSQLYVPPGL
ncbi:GntR family transcriptional regulator [Cohaesibacter gelatinilyticus]|uniref:Transcriptional regulator, GntR family n=1 Tax=Cohaesibacter gelatinilyticus TaxID=372072 RepID=A0A285NFZ3_9HYPH|nr:GntR family transcriptional regulator [Cohaesibacter gelatinilyticus]SNZ06581.1 transcriptional regulator, GntR family [Cohaesibacter gelatinilyticus]